MEKLLDLYTDYLQVTFRMATATGLFEMVDDAVKIVSFYTPGMKAEDVTTGLVGYQRTIMDFGGGFFLPRRYNHTESPLFQIPFEELEAGELAILLAACP